MSYNHDLVAGPPPHSYTRSRSQNKGSTDSSKSRDRGIRPPSQKAMLSRALQKANAAVQLDNASNIEGAREAYGEACELLQQVLVKTPGQEDRLKLEAIRETYTSRIEELDQLVASQRMRDTRPLPRRPPSRITGRYDSQGVYLDDVDESLDYDAANAQDDAIIETVRITRIYNDGTGPELMQPRSVPSYSVPLSSSSPKLQQSAFANTTTNGSPRNAPSLLNDQYTLQSSFSRSPRKDSPLSSGINNNARLPTANLQPANQYMPPPLSPRHAVPPPRSFDEPPPTSANDHYAVSANHYGSSHGVHPSGIAADTMLHASNSSDRNGNSTTNYGHTRSSSHESVSWLDPINESSSSRDSSVHSRSSSMGIRRKHIRGASGATEAEFDAALDDAIEAAYDDVYEPSLSNSINGRQRTYGSYRNDDQVSNSLRKVELAKKHVRETEREALAFERQFRLREQLRQQQGRALPGRDMVTNFLDPSDDSDEEERILEEMTTGYAIEDFAFTGSRAGPPKPVPSAALSTVSENISAVSKGPTYAMPPPPTQALPQLPPQVRSSASQSPVRASSALSVRNRRLSGQNMAQLKIQTTQLGPPFQSEPPATAGNVSSMPNHSASAGMSQQPRTAGFLVQQRQALSTVPRPGSSSGARPGSGAGFRSGSKQPPTPSPNTNGTMYLGPSPVEPVPPPNFPPPTPPIPQAAAFADQENAATHSGSPAASRPTLRKNFSSSSLRSLRSRNMSATNVDGGSDMSPVTPLSTQFAQGSRPPDISTLTTPPTPVTSSYRERMNMPGNGAAGLHLLDNDFHSLTTPGSPNPLYTNAPTPLEPCPTDTMLRPFWLMRCLYQTLVHPCGGYLSTKLFIPSDVWKVKGVKLKNVDEKVWNCNLLTDALVKLARVDTCDADAMLEEMQSFEGVLEQVQNVLARKLGNDVGVQSANALFKESSTGIDSESTSGSVPRTASVSGGSRSFSWRRLRPKNSSAGLHAASVRKESMSDGVSKDGGGTLASLPMTAHPTSRPPKRDVATVRFSGPNATYMSSLARLFDAAQSIDQIARQVEDPGLRHADKTQVGLELCTRHAAEFFAFYICRFVLSDVTLLTEKYVKRGSEWVLS